MGRGGLVGILENPLALGGVPASLRRDTGRIGSSWLLRAILPDTLSFVSPSLLDRMNTWSRGADDELHKGRLRVARTFILSILFINILTMIFAVVWGLMVGLSTALFEGRSCSLHKPRIAAPTHTTARSSFSSSHHAQTSDCISSELVYTINTCLGNIVFAVAIPFPQLWRIVPWSFLTSFVPTITTQTVFAYRHFWLQGMCPSCQSIWRLLLDESPRVLRGERA